MQFEGELKAVNDFEIISQKENNAVFQTLNGKDSNHLLQQLLPQVKIVSFQEQLPSINDIFIQKSVNNEQHLTHHTKRILIKCVKKSFLIMTLLLPFLMAGIVVVPTYLAMNSTEERNIAILDESNLLPVLEATDEITHFHYVEGNIETEKEHLNSEVFYALVHIPPSESLEELKDKITIYSDKQVSLSVGQIENLIENKAEKIKLSEAGIDPQTLKDANIRFELKTIILGAEGEEATGNAEASLGIGFVSGFLIYIFIFMYGAMVMRGVIEEKTNRIVEVIISSIKPFQLMMGKIVGVALVGLTQFVLWMLLTLVLTTVAEGFVFELARNDGQQLSRRSTIEKGMMMNQVSTAFGGIPLGQLAIAFLFYFLGGYLLYSSLCSRWLCCRSRSRHPTIHATHHNSFGLVIYNDAVHH